MSDPTAEPGAPAPSKEQSNIPDASEKSVSAEAQKRAPNQLLKLAATPDSIILRLNKLLAAPGGLPAFLSTFNYTLYLLAYFEAKSTPLRLKIAQFLNKNNVVSTAAVADAAAAPSHIAALGGMLSSTRTTLRLFGLIPMYAWFRQLMQGPKPGQDQVLYATAVTQCTLYIAFQFLENVALLTDFNVLPKSYTNRWTAAHGGKTARIYLWSYRAWMGGVLCDFVRLFREAQLQREKRSGSEVSTKEAEEQDAQWWSQLVVPMAWLPMAVQFSVEGGIPGYNLGMMGASGFFAGLGKISEMWAKTAE